MVVCILGTQLSLTFPWTFLESFHICSGKYVLKCSVDDVTPGNFSFFFFNVILWNHVFFRQSRMVCEKEFYKWTSTNKLFCVCFWRCQRNSDSDTIINTWQPKLLTYLEYKILQTGAFLKWIVWRKSIF